MSTETEERIGMSKEGVKIVSLNIEGNKRLPVITNFLAEVRPDAVLVQEAFKSGVHHLSRELRMDYVFAPTCIRPVDYVSGADEEWGVALLSPRIIHIPRVDYYGGDGYELPRLEVGPRGEPLVHAARGLVRGTILKEGQQFNMATTHFTWTPDGQATDQQRADLNSLLSLIGEEENLIFAGDFNAPRGGEIHTDLGRRGRLRYWIPPHVTTTIDGKNHRAGDLQLVVDHLYTRGDYSVGEVGLIDGVSDHWAVVARIQSGASANLDREDFLYNKLI